MDVLTISDGWLYFIIAAVTVGFIAYGIGYRSGKDRALRDNRNDKK